MKLSQLSTGQYFTFSQQNDKSVYKVIRQRNLETHPLSTVTLLIDKKLRRNRLRTTHCTTIQNMTTGRLKTLHFAREISVRPIRKSFLANTLRWIVGKFTMYRENSWNDVSAIHASTYDKWRIFEVNPPN